MQQLSYSFSIVLRLFKTCSGLNEAPPKDNMPIIKINQSIVAANSIFLVGIKM